MATNIPADNNPQFFTRTRTNADPKLMRRLDAVCDAEQPLKALKKEFNISMRDICELFGASYRTLQNWNAGVNKPSNFVIRAVVECAVVNNRRRHE